MHKPAILISNPDVKVVEAPDRLSICLGFRPEIWQGDQDWLLDDSAVERKCVGWGDASVIQVIRENSMPVQVRIWRPVVSFHELYFTNLPDGKILFADHLRNIIAELPLDRRNLRDEALVDFMLFRSAPGKHTFCGGVERVGRGERVTIDLRTGEARRTQFDRLRNIAEKAPFSTYLDRIDQALEEAIKPLRKIDGVVDLFSGGVDSTVLHSYLGTNVPALMGHTWSMVEFEKEYGARAAELLNIKLRTFRVEEHEYLPLLEGAVESGGQPPRFDQVVMMYKAFQQPGKAFVCGGTADAVFGADHVKGGVVRAARVLAGLPGGGWIARALRKTGRAQLSRLALVTDLLTKPPTQARGLAAIDGLVTNMDLAERIFGPRLVSRRLQERIEGVLPAIEYSARPNDRVGRHLELLHLCQQIVEDAMEQFRHIAQGVGKAYLGPYLNRSVVDSCLRVPVEERYLRGSRAKYLLKELLRRRVPDYPVDQTKGMGLIDAESFYTDGPMRDIWDRYELPDFLTGANRENFLERPNTMTFNVASLAIWRDRVLRNEGLKVTPEVRRFGG